MYFFEGVEVVFFRIYDENMIIEDIHDSAKDEEVNLDSTYYYVYIFDKLTSFILR